MFLPVGSVSLEHAPLQQGFRVKWPSRPRPQTLSSSESGAWGAETLLFKLPLWVSAVTSVCVKAVSSARSHYSGHDEG